MRILQTLDFKCRFSEKKHWYYNIVHFLNHLDRQIRILIWNIKNIIGWSRILWNNFDWDESFLFQIMEYKLLRMSEYFKTMGMSVDRDRQAKECKTTALVLRRLIDCDYSIYDDCGPSPKRNVSWTEEKYFTKQDIEYLCTMLKKHVRNWWD